MNTGKRTPKQERSRATVEAILDSAIQILEEGGLGALRVAALAERSGYGVGTLYQYFDKIDGVMLALVESWQEKQRQILVAQVGRLAATGAGHDTRDVIRLWLGAMGRRRAAQKALIDWALARPDVRALEGRNTFLAQMLASISAQSQGLPLERMLNDIEMFVLSRAFLGVVRNALWSENQDIEAPQFVDALADLVDGFVVRVAHRDAGGRGVRAQRTSRAGTPAMHP